MNHKLLLSFLLLVSLFAMMRVVRARRGGGDIIILGTGGHGGHGHHHGHQTHHHDTHHQTHQTHYLPVPIYMPCNCGHDYGHLDYNSHMDYNALHTGGYTGGYKK